MIKVLELFSGVGSQTQALKNIGVSHESIISEIDKNAIRVYEELHGCVVNMGDITMMTSIPEVDLLTYSFPCQDISVAGNQVGLSKRDGTRSGLLWEVERLLVSTENKPKYLLMENVKSLLNNKNKKDFAEWCNFLESVGYVNSYSVLNSFDFGVPQKRDRVFMVSHLCGKKFDFNNLKKTKPKHISKFLEPNELVSSKFTITQPSMLKKIGVKKSHGLFVIDDYCNTITTKQLRCPNSGIISLGNGEYRLLTPKETWRLMGFRDSDFDKAERVCGNTNLYKQAGNSIVVPVLEAIFKEMKLGEI